MSPRRALLALATVALAPLPATASAAPAMITPGTLTVALNMPSDGFQVGPVKGREVVAARGYEIDLAEAIAAKLSLRVSFVQEPRFTSLIAAGDRAWDLALAQVSATEVRRARVDFSVPYLTADQGALLSHTTTARPPSSPTSAGCGSVPRRAPRAPTCSPRRSRRTSRLLLPAIIMVLTRGLISGRCEAVIFDAPGLAVLRAQVPTRYGPLAGVIRTGESYGAVFSKGSRLRGRSTG